MDLEALKTVYQLLEQPMVLQILRTTTVSQMRMLGTTASSRKDPARNMRLSNNLARPFPIMVKHTPEILGIMKTNPELFHKDPEHDQHNISPASLLLVDMIAFNDLPLNTPKWDYTKTIDIAAIEKCKHLFTNVSLMKDTQPMQAMMVRKDMPIIETKVPMNALLKALICPDLTTIGVEEAHALSILKPWFPMFNHLSIEAISHKVRSLINPPIKHIRANQQLPVGYSQFQPLVQFENLRVNIPGLITTNDDNQLIRSCRYLLQTTFRDTDVRNARVERLRGLIQTAQLSGMRLENRLKTTNNKNLNIQICQMALGLPMQQEINTSRFSMKIIVSNTKLEVVSYITPNNQRIKIEKYIGEETIVFKYRSNPRIQGIFKRNIEPPHGLMLMDDFCSLPTQEQAKVFADIIMTFKTHTVIIDQIPALPIKNMKDLYDRILNVDLSHELGKFVIEYRDKLNYDYRTSLYTPELLPDLSVVNKGATGGDKRLSIYSSAMLLETVDPKPIDLTISETRLSVYEIIVQAWEALFYDTYTYNTVVHDIIVWLSDLPNEEKHYSIIFKMHQRRIRNSLSCDQQFEAKIWLRESITNEKEKRVSFLLWIIASSAILSNGMAPMNSVKYGEFMIQPHLPNSNFYESDSFYMILGHKYTKIEHNRDSLKRKYDLTPTHQVKRSKIMTVSSLINSGLPEAIVQVGGDIFRARKRKYEDTIDKWVTDSIDTRVLKKPRVEDVDTDSDDGATAGPSGEVVDIQLDDDDMWFDSD